MGNALADGFHSMRIEYPTVCSLTRSHQTVTPSLTTALATKMMKAARKPYGTLVENSWAPARERTSCAFSPTYLQGHYKPFSLCLIFSKTRYFQQGLWFRTPVEVICGNRGYTLSYHFILSLQRIIHCYHFGLNLTALPLLPFFWIFIVFGRYLYMAWRLDDLPIVTKTI